MSSPYKRQQIYHEYHAKKCQIKAADASKEIVYPNQTEAANEIFEAFMLQDKVAVTLIALPQAGKTGTFLEVAYRMCTFNDDAKAIDPEQLLIITGMSDREWRWQTSDDMLTTFKKRVKHRGQFESVPTLLNTLHDSLIIIDECHIAAEKEQSMSAMLRDAGLLNIEELRRRRIFLLEVSATPGHTLYDTQNWGADNHSIVILKESPIYVGFRDFIRENRLHESYDLTNMNDLERLFDFIEDHFEEPKYHILRLNGKKNLDALTHAITNAAKERGWRAHPHNSTNRMWDLDEIMKKAPDSHSIILIKEFWRAGKRLCDTHVGIVHEPRTLVEDTNVTSQGLVGRLCGNDKHKGKGAPHAFCNTSLICDYLAWIDAKGDYEAVKQYKSRNLTAKKGNVRSTASFTHYTNVEGVQEIQPAQTPRNNILEEGPFTTIEEVNEFLTYKFGRAFTLREFHTVQGYKISTRLNAHYNKTKNELTAADRLTTEIYKKIPLGMNISTSSGQHYMVYPVYKTMTSLPNDVEYFVRYMPESQPQVVTNRVMMPQQTRLPF